MSSVITSATQRSPVRHRSQEMPFSATSCTDATGSRRARQKYGPRGVAGVVAQQKQPGSPDGQILVAKCDDLHGSNGYVTGETRAPRLRKPVPSTDKIVRDFKFRPHYAGGNNPERDFVHIWQLGSRQKVSAPQQLRQL